MFTGEIQHEENKNLSDLDTSLNIPSGAIIHDLKGDYIYPSFIESYVFNDAQKISDLVQLFSGGLN